MKVNIFGDFYADKTIQTTKQLTDKLANAEANILNLEAPVLQKPCVPIQKVGASLRHTPSVLDNLKLLNITDVCLANNHYFDYGFDAAKKSTMLLIRNNIRVHGVDKNNYSKDFQFLNDKTVIVNVAESENGCRKSILGKGFISVSDPFLFVYLNDFIKRDIQIILIIHAGLENSLTPLNSWKNYYRAFVDLGVELVIAHHPHVPQHHEIYNGKYIFYSLGNFVFQSKTENKWHNTSKFVSISLNESIEVEYYYTRYENNTLSLLDDEEKIQTDKILAMKFNEPLNLTRNYVHRQNMDIKRVFLNLLGSKILRSFGLFKGKSNRKYDFHLHNIKFETHRFSQIEHLEKKLEDKDG
ncbi:CapA family protein [Vibrio sp. A1-1]|uniref:CapA family protein n=1 Tax=Vibrio sp. A1-1 TaxID=2912250 RepID=UPI001F1AB8F7|nr:CapA family protein [Vibrio sp. A1-1]MCF7455158.1 CapA family protein [Vibrio sp. A1-1]